MNDYEHVLTSTNIYWCFSLFVRDREKETDRDRETETERQREI